MSILKIAIRVAICIAVVNVISSFVLPVERGKFNITINHFVGARLLNLDNTEYKNELGQVFTVSRFRYYLGHIKLKSTDGKEFDDDQYFLIDEAEPDSKKISLDNIPAGKYTSISFVVGVDSLHNCSGAQSGALDPVNGMFWTWSTGYIFLKLEGHAKTANSPGHIFEYHIGGYMAPHNCIRTVTLKLGNNGLNISSKKENSLLLKADILKILGGMQPVDFSKLSSVTDFHNATIVADNYMNMFTISTDQ